MKPIHIATSPLTNRIYAGHVLKCGTAWGANKQDVTGAACGSVCEHVMANGGEVIVSANGKPKFEISVRDLEAVGAQPAPKVPDFRRELSRLLEAADRYYQTGEGEEEYEVASLDAFNALAQDAHAAAVRGLKP